MYSMNVFLHPVIALMNRLKYPKKFALIFLLFFSLIVASSLIIVSQKQSDINNAKGEIIGLESIIKLQSIVQTVQQHRGLSAVFLGGNESVKDKMKEKQAEIEGNITSLDEYLKSNNAVSSHTQQWNTLKEKWGKLKNDVGQLTGPESFNQHTKLIEEMLLLGSSIADSTNLTLESDLVHNHLARIITNDLIYSTEYMGQARAVGSNVLAAKKMTIDQKSKLLYLSQLMDNSLKRAEGSMNIILEANEEARQKISEDYNNSMNAARNFGQLIMGEILEKEELIYDSAAYFEEATKAIDTIYAVIKSNQGLFDGLLVEEISKLSFQRNMTVLVDVIIILFAIILFIAFYKSVKENIEMITLTTEKIAAGDLTKRIQLKTNDETKQIQVSINSMLDSIHQMIGKVSTAAEHVAANSIQLSANTEQTSRATEQIAQAITDIAAGADDQLSNMQAASNSVNEIASGVSRIAENVETVKESTKKASDTASSGNEAVKKAVHQIELINSKTEETANVLNLLGEKSNEIESIITMITAIAAQTNLLALNASIEAARAGEHGKGFAVVADEVRKLAEESGSAASKISSLISIIQENMKLAIDAMGEGRTAVRGGTTLVEQAGDYFEKITEAVVDVVSQIEEMTYTVQKVNSGASQLVGRIEDVKNISGQSAHHSQSVASITEEQTASVQEIAASLGMLSQVAEDLRDSVEMFRI